MTTDDPEAVALAEARRVLALDEQAFLDELGLASDFRLGRIVATTRGRLLLRNIAMCFDRYLDQPSDSSRTEPRFSRAI